MGYETGYGGGYGPTEDETTTPPVVTPAALGELRHAVEIDFVNPVNPLSEVRPPPVWTDAYPDVRQPDGWKVRSGRSRAVDRNEAATASVVLDDPERKYDPSNPDSIHFPNVRPQLRLRISTLHFHEGEPFELGVSELGDDDGAEVGGGDTYSRLVQFDGAIESWSFDYPLNGFDGTATIQASDAMAAWNRDEVHGFEAFAELPGDRINRILNTRAWTGRVAGSQGTALPSPERNIYRPQSTDDPRYVADVVYEHQNMLEALRQVAESGGGNLFISRDGRPTYLAPDSLSAPRPSLRFAMDGDSEMFKEAAFAYDGALIFNAITVTAPNQPDVTVTDEDSIERYWRSSRTFETILFSPSDQEARAVELLQRFREPVRLISHLDVSDLAQDWEAVLGVDLWTKIVLEYRFPDGTTLEQVSLIEGRDLASPSSDRMLVAWWLSPAPFLELLEDSEADFEIPQTPGWQPEVNCTVAQQLVVPGFGVPVSVTGFGSLYITPTADGDASIVTTALKMIAPNASYLFTAHVRFDIEDAHLVSAHLEIDWIDAALAVLATTVGDDVGPTSGPSGAGKWYLAQASGRAPASAAYARLRVAFPDCTIDISHGHYGRWIDRNTFARS